MCDLYTRSSMSRAATQSCGKLTIRNISKTNVVTLPVDTDCMSDDTAAGAYAADQRVGCVAQW